MKIGFDADLAFHAADQVATVAGICLSNRQEPGDRLSMPGHYCTLGAELFENLGELLLEQICFDFAKGTSALSSHDLGYWRGRVPGDGIRVLLRPLLISEEPAPLQSRL